MAIIDILLFQRKLEYLIVQKEIETKELLNIKITVIEDLQEDMTEEEIIEPHLDQTLMIENLMIERDHLEEMNRIIDLMKEQIVQEEEVLMEMIII